MVWLIGGLLLLILVSVLAAVGVFGAPQNRAALVAVIPIGGRGDRAEILDRAGNWKGYGVRRPDGSWDFFAEDDSKLDVVAKPDGGVTGLKGNEVARIVLQPRRGK